NQPNNKPIGKLPTSPRNNCATGRLKGANPMIAPHNASATNASVQGSAPMKPNSAIVAVAGTSSTTVIQSMPSIKFTTFTNQRMARKRKSRSTHHGTAGNTRNSLGSAAITVPIAAACKNKRGTASSERTSSATPTTASKSADAKTT